MRTALMALCSALALSALTVAPSALACDGQKTASTEASAKGSDNAQLASAQFKVDGMSCAVSCPVAIRTALTGLTGVSEVTVDFESHQVSVRYSDSEVTPDQMVEAITKLGYKAEAVKKTDPADDKAES